ncbi:condensation domain-containing protein [Promicromonospora sp. AC04]|uniref:condensation domain-containing protein n=1 Tax=Promicromonospora sp. AC04 TaxID=2135723 RepID=UPI000D391FAC|nr:condensation domain-containing protein [Promicromonospora sp. AC04]PUB23466.1 condensation domain-containing protein [Promicromonospora sp. AC04]
MSELHTATHYQRSLYDATGGQASGVNVGAAVRMRGPVDPERIRIALDALTARHEALRTTLTRQDITGAPHQVIGSQPPLELREVSVLDADEDQREPACAALLQAELRRPFVLKDSPLARALLVTLADDDRVFAMIAHHAIMDGWSAGVIRDEFPHLYEYGTSATLPPPVLHLADYAAWEAELAGDPATQEHWRAALAGARPRLAFASDVPAVGAVARTTPHPLQLDRGPTLGALHPLMVEEQASPTAALLAALAASLSDHVTNERITFGVMRSNRQQRDVRGTVGFLAGHVPVTVDLSGDPTCATLVGRTADAYDRAISRPAPVSVLRAALPVTGRGPLFDVSLNYGHQQARHQAGVVVEGAGVTFSPFDLAHEEPTDHPWWDGASLLDFQISSDPAGRLSGTLVADAHMFGDSEASGFAGRFAAALRRFADRPRDRLSDLVAAKDPAP